MRGRFCLRCARYSTRHGHARRTRRSSVTGRSSLRVASGTYLTSGRGWSSLCNRGGLRRACRLRVGRLFRRMLSGALLGIAACRLSLRRGLRLWSRRSGSRLGSSRSLRRAGARRLLCTAKLRAREHLCIARAGLHMQRRAAIGAYARSGRVFKLASVAFHSHNPRIAVSRRRRPEALTCSS